MKQEELIKQVAREVTDWDGITDSYESLEAFALAFLAELTKRSEPAAEIVAGKAGTMRHPVWVNGIYPDIGTKLFTSPPAQEANFVGAESFRTQAVSTQLLQTSPGGGDEDTGTNSGMYHERDKCLECLREDKAALVAKLEDIQQKVAEACAEMCGQLTHPYPEQNDARDSWVNGTFDCEKAIRAGKWKEYLKS